ncbi:MAG: hypothetical protein ACLRMZ_15370 [Blautia marasmi]
MLNYIEEHYREDLSLDFLAEYFKISKTYINRLLKNNTGKLSGNPAGLQTCKGRTAYFREQV